MAGVGIDLDKETDAARLDRHRDELADLVDALFDAGEQPTFGNMYEVTERHRLEWLLHPTAESLARRLEEKERFALPASDTDEEGEPKPRPAKPRRGRRVLHPARRR